LEDGAGQVPAPSRANLYEAGGIMNPITYYTGVVTFTVAASVLALYYGAGILMWAVYWMVNLT
jgi:hypothetical protein